MPVKNTLTLIVLVSGLVPSLNWFLKSLTNIEEPLSILFSIFFVFMLVIIPIINQNYNEIKKIKEDFLNDENFKNKKVLLRKNGK